MIFGKLWERYLFYELWKIFLFFIFAFYFLYMLIDYSVHAHHFSKIHNLRWLDLSTYYFYLFIKRADLILPLTLLISTNKVLLGLNQNNVMISLFVGGLSKAKLLRPFFITAFGVTCLLFLNFEYLTPRSLDYLEYFENQYFRQNKSKRYTVPSAYAVSIDNGRKLLFSTYDSKKKCFNDVYYIKNQDDIWKMKQLEVQATSAQGYYVDHLIRDETNQLVKENSYTTQCFPDLIIDFSFRKNATPSFEQQSISSLYSIIKQSKSLHIHHISRMQTQFFFKIFIPFSSFLVIIACAPFCITFSRRLRIFMIYAMSVFSIIAFFTVLDAAVILGEHQTFPPFLTIAAPFVISFVGFGLKFIKTYSQ